MKKKLLIGIFLIITVSCALAFTFAGCNDECEHRWKDATCTEPKTCDLCKETEGDPKGHSYKTEYSRDEAKHWYECTVCGSKKDEQSHTWNADAATEHSDKYCTVCNYVAEYQIGHTHTFDSVLSYDDEGHYYAASCGHTQEKKDYAYHTFSTSTVQPTCTEQGYTVHSCSCGKAVKDNYVAAHGHEFCQTLTKDGAGHWYAASCVHSTERKDYATHTYTPVVTEPTCTEQGYTTYTCACGDYYVSDYKDAKGHSVAEWSEAGSTLYDARTCKHEVRYSGFCSGCNTTQKKTEYIEMHAFTEKTEKPATCIAEGTIHKFCKNEDCKYYTAPYEVITYTDTNAHSWVEDTANSTTDVTAYKCNNGDCKATKKSVSGGTEASVSKDDIKNVDEIKLTEATIGLDSGIKDKLSKSEGNVSISAGTLEGTERDNAINTSNLSQDQKDLLGDSKIYNFTVNNGDVDDLGGNATIKLPYTLGENEDPDNIIVWYIKKGSIEGVAAVYSEEDGVGYVTFTTDHFSYYTVTRIDPKLLCVHLGHDLKNAHTVAPTCTEIGYTVCLRCGKQVEDSFVEPNGHSWQTKVISKNSCAQNGETEYSCSVCSLSYRTVVPATGHYFVLENHVSASCTASGSTTHGCIYCDSEYSVTVPQLSHNYVSKTVAPTCEERGYTEKTCTLCADTIYVSFTNATGHTPDSEWHKDPSGHYHMCNTCSTKLSESAHVPGAAATEQSAQICTVCEYVIVPQLSHTHALTKVPAVSADCVNVGNIEYYTCQCGKWFTDAAGTQLITNHVSVIIDANGHTYESIAHQEPTCTEVGYTAGVKCSVCDTVIKGHVEIAPHGHILKTEETAPTCTKEGKTVTHCLYCDDAYSEQSIAALGHKYVSDITAPTCTEDGYTTLTCTRCNDSYVDDEKDALGHSFSSAWLTDENGHWHVCSRCDVKSDEGAHTPDRDAATVDDAKSCTKCGYVIEERLNHTHAPSKTVAEKAPTCTESGNLTYYVCSCDEWFYDESCKEIIIDTSSVMVKHLDHKLSYVEQTDPTCTEVGYTDGYYCSRCESFLSGHEEIPAAGHKHSGEWSSDENEHWHECACGDKADKAEHIWNAPSATEQNDKHCTECNYVAEQRLEHTHKYNDWTDEVPASCTKDGKIGHYTCSCGRYFDADKKEVTDLTIPAPGHKHSGEWSSDENEHWHECACGDKADKAEHSYTDGKCKCGKEYVAPAPSKLYSFNLVNEYTDLIISFISDGTFSATGTEKQDDGSVINVTYTGTWEESEDGTIAAYMDGDFVMRFGINKEDNSLYHYICETHTDTTEYKEKATCQNEGYLVIVCNRCAEIVSTELLPKTDHNYIDGACDVCGAKEETKPEVTVSYTYTHLTDTENVVFTFYSDGSFTEAGKVTIEGKEYNINETGTWEINKDGELEATLIDVTVIFTIDVDGRLTLKGMGEAEPKTLYSYVISNPYAEVTITFLSDYTLTAVGSQLVEDDRWEPVNETGTWSYNEDGNIAADLYGSVMLFVIGEDGNLTMQGGGGGSDTPTAGVVYTYHINYPYMDVTISFLSDYTLTAVGTMLGENGKWGNVDDTGTWSVYEDGSIEAILFGETAIFTVDADGNLTMQDGEGAVKELYTFTVNTDTANITISFMSDYNFNASGYYFNEHNDEVWINESHWWRYASDTAIMAYVFGENRVFEIDEDGNLTLNETDNESATVVYSYDYKSDDYDATLSFLSNYRLVASGWRLDRETGNYTEQFTNDGWWYFENDFIVADIGANYGNFILLEDGSIILEDDCTHPNTKTLLAFDGGCLLTGYEITFCELCGDLISEKYIDPAGHSFDDNGVCTGCGASLGAPKPTETYKFEYKDDETEFVLSFLSDNTYTLQMLKGQIDEDINKDNFVGDWIILDDGTICANLFGYEFFRFEIDENGNLSFYVCKHENTFEKIDEPSCDEPGIKMIFCLDCNEMLYTETLDPKGHDYDENDICTNCGRNKNDVEGGEPDPNLKEVAYIYMDKEGLSITLYKDMTVTGTNRVTSSDGLSYVQMISGSWRFDDEGKTIKVYDKSTVYTFSVDEYDVLTLISTGENTCTHEDTYTETPDKVNCEMNSFIKVICNTCGMVVSIEEVPAKEHVYGEDGSCTNCGYVPCKHENIITESYFNATCLLTGYEFTFCESCGKTISESYTDPTGHTFDENGICADCGINKTDPEPTETYKYEYEDDEVKYVIYFFSNEVFNLNMLKGQVEEGIDKSFFAGSWHIDEKGIIHAYLLGDMLYQFIVDTDGNISEYECKHTNTETVTTEATCKYPGSIRIYCVDCGETVNERFTQLAEHKLDENGKCEVCGYTENGEIIAPIIKPVIFLYTDSLMQFSLYSDNSASAVLRDDTDTGYTVMGSWEWGTQPDLIIVRLEDKTFVFSVTETGKDLVLEGQSNGICNHENTRSYNQFDPTCRISGFGAIVCTDCAYTVSTGYIDPIAHSFTDGFCEYCYLAEDAEITVEYTYDHVLSDGEYSLAFLSDGTFTVNATRQTEDGTVEKIYFVGEWSINDSNIIDTYVISINYQRFNVDNDGNLSLYVCDHSEGTYDRTVDPGCETDGYRQLFCMLCHDLISETPIPATGHNFNNGSCDYCGEVESGGEVIDKTVSYGYKDDNLSLTLYSDYTVEGSSIGITSDGMSILDKVVGKWIMHYESNRITVDLNIGSFTFDVVNGHELVLVNENGSEGGEGDSTACNHENIYDETVDPDGCFTDGYIRVICKDCKNVISDMPIPAEHSYDENGICTNCGTEDKNNTIVTPDYNYGIAG